MIKLITGKKGTGKTKIIIDRINNAVKSTTGDLVCI
jgi:F0F1-type ATP synthase alpha subunit